MKSCADTKHFGTDFVGVKTFQPCPDTRHEKQPQVHFGFAGRGDLLAILTQGFTLGYSHIAPPGLEIFLRMHSQDGALLVLGYYPFLPTGGFCTGACG